MLLPAPSGKAQTHTKNGNSGGSREAGVHVRGAERHGCQVRAVIDVEQGKSAPPANIIDVKPVLEAGEKHETTAPELIATTTPAIGVPVLSSTDAVIRLWVVAVFEDGARRW